MKYCSCHLHKYNRNPEPYEKASHGICGDCLAEVRGKPTSPEKLKKQQEDFINNGVTVYCAWCKKLLYDPKIKLHL